MFKKLAFYLLISAFCSSSFDVKAQVTIAPANKLKLDKYQDSLKTLSDSSFSTLLDQDKLNFNADFSKKLVLALKTPQSFYYDFDSVKNVSFLKSPDNSFKIITWFLPMANGSYKFYGSIQMKGYDNQLKLLPLNDDTANFTDLNIVTGSKNWYGARYYDIAPVTSPGRPTIYALLGWKGNNTKTSKKVIDILSFEKGEPVFGKGLFETAKYGGIKNRVVFEYAKQNTMTLSYDKVNKMIIFDHLAPFDSEMAGNFEYYASDLSFDAYIIGYTKFRLKEDVDMKNEASETDEMYVPPRKASTIKTSRQ